MLHVLSVENANRGKCQPMHPSLAYGGMYSNTTEWEIIGKIRILCERVYLSPSPVASNYVPTANDEVFVLSKKKIGLSCQEQPAPAWDTRHSVTADSGSSSTSQGLAQGIRAVRVAPE